MAFLDNGYTKEKGMVGNLIKVGSKAVKSGASWLQEILPGVKAVRGVEKVPERPGMYSVNPSEMADSSWLRRAERQMADEARLAEYGTRGVLSVSGVERAKASNMLLGALNELRYASMRGVPKSSKEAVKGVVWVDKSGNVKGGAAVNRVKAGEYLADKSDLDFTRISPNYLEYVSTTSPDVRGSDLLREIQKLYGDDMVFQVANPKKNVPIYEAMGARRMPLRHGGEDVLGGSYGLPAFRIENRIPDRTPKKLTPEGLEELGQERLPGFKEGGSAGRVTELKEPSNFRPAKVRSKEQAFKEGLVNAPFYAAAWPLMVTDVVESGLDALRGVKSPNRMTQVASNLKQLFGGDPIPQEYERGVEPWEVSKYELAGSLPTGGMNPLRAIGAVPAALRHGAGSFVRASAAGMPTVVKRSGWNFPGELARRFEEVAFPMASPEQIEALKAYVKNPMPFKPHNRNMRASVEFAAARGDLTPRQIDNLEGTRQALLDVLSNTIDLPGPIYRGVNLPNLPRPLGVVGGQGPASFSADPMQAGLFTQPVAGKKRVLIQAYQDADRKPKGVVLPVGFGSAPHEREVILHPRTNVIVEKRMPVKPNAEFGDLHSFEGFLDWEKSPDVSAWASGGHVTPIHIPPGTETSTTGTRGRSETLPDRSEAGYNSSERSWDIFGTNQ